MDYSLPVRLPPSDFGTHLEQFLAGFEVGTPQGFVQLCFEEVFLLVDGYFLVAFLRRGYDQIMHCHCTG